MTKNIFYSILAGFIFLFLAVITLSDYNITWDERTHFVRGQAFANFFLHGKVSNENPITKDFARYYRDYLSSDNSNRDISNLVSQDSSYRKSIYQDQLNLGYFDKFIKGDTFGHPPLSDIGSAFSNMFFYEKLGIVRDDHAYGLFSVMLASILVGLFFYWISSLYGFFPAFISTLALATTPLFWAEAHNNIKDIPLLVFFSFAIWAFWKGVTNQSREWIFFSALFAGFALGTKFNILFLPFIIIPWFALHFFKSPTNTRKIYLKWWWFFLAYPIIMFTILFATWPQLWHDSLSNLLKVFGYYKDIGTNIDYTPAFRTIFGFNTYATLWIFYTTYPIIIVLSLIGVIGWIVRLKKTKDFLPFLFLLWFLVPIMRVSLPNTAIYGGIRQIIEYIPAIAFFAGYGVYVLFSFISPRLKIIFYFLIVLSFVPLILTLVRIHPAENIYFNSLIGGLQGAKKANITDWGNTDGGIYEVAVKWLNKNADKNSHIATAFSDPSDFYIPELREDLLADNLFSGYLQKGEYVVGLTYNSGLENTYGLLYPETFLNPVYVYSVDGVPLVKIWKNDKEHIKKEFFGLKLKDFNVMPQKQNGQLMWKLGSEERIMAVEIKFSKNNSCKDLVNANFQVSADGQIWTILPETYPGGPVSYLGSQPKGNKLIAPFAGIEARYIALVIDPTNACLFRPISSTVSVFE